MNENISANTNKYANIIKSKDKYKQISVEIQRQKNVQIACNPNYRQVVK